MATAKTAAAKKAAPQANGGKGKARAKTAEKAFRNTLVVVESPAKAKTIK